MKTTISLFLIAITVVASEPLVPINELGTGTFHGFIGGLYANGSNEPHAAHAQALRERSARIQPLDAEGKPSATGRIVIAGVGASVCRQIFAQLERRGTETPGIHPAITFVNCASGGADVNKITEERYWQRAEQALAARGVSARQVQVVWYQSDELRDQRDDFPGRPQRLQAALAQQMKLIAQHFPNAQLCYHSARHTTAFMPDDDGKAKHAEPRPYHVGWAVKWFIESPENGGHGTPLSTWATYFWTQADKPRADGYQWPSAMNVKDGVHLTEAGQQRVAKELCEFWSRDPFAQSWFTDSLSPPPTKAISGSSP